ncbi:MAG: DUF3854 domain-containing protein [Sandaracinaceae bacterium]|nr:DUF3854 domain-containing protein [Sandaracinaceae bacterium]
MQTQSKRLRDLLGRFRAAQRWFQNPRSVAMAEAAVAARMSFASALDASLREELRTYIAALTSAAEAGTMPAAWHASLLDDRDDAERLLRLGVDAWLDGVPLCRDHVDMLLLDLPDLPSGTLSEMLHDGTGPMRAWRAALAAERAATRRYAEAAGIWTETDPAILTVLLAAEKDQFEIDGIWMVFPYIEPGHTRAAFYRAKRTHTPTGALAESKGYRQPADINGVYFPPRTRASDDRFDVTVPLVITEGERKALCLDRLGYLAVAVPGVWGAGNGKGEMKLHQWLRRHTALVGRVVVLAFDSDMLSNARVRAGTRRTRELLEAEGAEVRIVDWTALRPKLNLAVTWGIDDLARLHGRDAVHPLIRSAAQRLPSMPIRIPASVAAMPIGPAQKIVYGALNALARDQRVEEVTQDAIGEATRRTRRAVGQALDGLDAVRPKLINRTRGEPTRTRMVGVYDDDQWYRDRDSYVLLHDRGDPVIEVDPADLGTARKARDTEALVLGILRANTAGLSRYDLARQAGISERTLRRTLAALRARVTVAADRITMR